MATKSGDRRLPGAWSHLSTRSPEARKGLPVSVYSGADAEYLMRMLMDNTDTIPVKYDQFFELGNRQKAKIQRSAEDVDAEMEDA
jgi:hypothetical protein